MSGRKVVTVKKRDFQKLRRRSLTVAELMLDESSSSATSEAETENQELPQNHDYAVSEYGKADENHVPDAHHEEPEADILPVNDSWNLKPHPNSQITTGEFLALLTRVADSSHLSLDGRNNLLHITKLLVPGGTEFPSSMYQLKSCLEQRDLSRPVETHLICPGCGTYFGPDDEKQDTWTCPEADCQTEYDRPHLTKFSFSYLPMEPALRTFMETSRNYKKDFRKGPGQSGTTSKGRVMQQYIAAGIPFVPVMIFSDGAATSKSSTSSIWVAQWHVPVPGTKPQPILSSIWYRSSRSNANNWKEPKKFKQGLLRPLINEIKNLQSAGLDFALYGVDHHVVVRVVCWISDSQERWKILMLSSFSAPYGCVHCEIPGKRIPINEGDNRTVQCYPLDNQTDLLENVRPLRTTNVVKVAGALAGGNLADLDDYYQFMGVQGSSVLSELTTFDQVLQVPAEPMHLCFEGLKKTFMDFRKSGPVWKLTAAQKLSLNRYILALQPPSEVTRTRPFSQAGHWHASEYLAFTLYYGLPALHGITATEDFLCYAKFATTCQLLFSSPTEELLPEIWKLSLSFAQELQKVGTARRMSYNLHQFSCHLVEYVYQLGHPAEFWAFEHEDYIGKLKRELKGTNDPGKELAGKMALSEASKKLETIYLSHSANSTAKKAQTTITRGLHAKKKTVSTPTGAHHFLGKAVPLHRIKQQSAVLGLAVQDALENYLPGAPETAALCYDRCLCANSISLDSVFYQRKVHHVDAAFSRSDGRIYLACKFLAFETAVQQVAAVACHPTAEKEWTYFGFSNDPVLRDKRFQQTYRNLTISEEIVVLPLDEVAYKVFMLPDHEDNHLAVVLSKNHPD